MTRRTTAAITAALALAACAAPVSDPAPVPAPQPAAAASSAGGGPSLESLDQAAATITPQDLHARIEFLASDQMRGRDTPSPELEIAAGYLVNQYRLMGYAPAGENATYLQWWPFPLRRLNAAAASFDVAGANGTTRLVLGRDFFSAGGTAAPISGAELVYAGSAADGVLAEGSLRNQVAVVALPGRYTRDWRLERNRQRGAAQRAGAAAVLYVLDPVWTADSIARYAQMAQAPTRSMNTGVAFPQLFVSQEAARRLFQAGGLSLDQQWGAASGVARPVPLAGATASLSLPVEMLDQARAPNVAAVLPGSDPALRNEYVVVSAHFDHVGVGAPVNGDSIYNGADDDASGTSGLLEVAQAFAELGVRPRRSILFLHVSGEEKGLAGSEWTPTIPRCRWGRSWPT